MTLIEKLVSLVIIGIVIIGIGCCVKATKQGDTMVLRGFGAKKATWPEGYSIEKDEPFSVPDIITK